MSNSPEPKKRRSCLGSFCMGGVGCTSFVLGSIVILVLLAPRILATWVPGMVEGTFNSGFQGSLEVGDASLAWSARQELSDVVLRDPDGGEVARATVTVPSILEFLSEEYRLIEVDLDADLFADDAGVTNIARALEARDDAEIDLGGSDGEASSGDSVIDHLDLKLVVRGRRISWSDARTRASGEPFAVRDLLLDAAVNPSGLKELSVDATIQNEAPSTLKVRASYDGTVRELREGDLSTLDVEVTGQGVSVALLDGLAGLQGDLVELLGPSIDAAIEVHDPLGSDGRVSVQIDGSEERYLHLEGGMHEGTFRFTPDVPVTGSLGFPFALVSEAVADLLPPGAILLPGDQHGPLHFEFYNSYLPEAALEQLRDGDVLGGLRSWRGHLVLEAPFGLYYQDQTTIDAGVITGVTSAHMEARTEGAEDPVAGTIYFGIDTGLPGDFEFTFKLGRPETNDPDVLYFDIQVRQLSSTAVDGYLGLNGCFAKAVGESFGFRAEGDGLTSEAGEIMSFIRAGGASANLHGHVEDGVLMLDPEHGLNAVLRPAPGWFERCLGRELPNGWTINLLLNQDQGVRFLTDGTAFPLPDDWSREGILAALAEGFGKTSYKLGTLRFARTENGVEQIVSFENIEAAAEMSEEGVLDISLTSGLYTGAAGSFEMQAHIENGREVLNGGDASGVELDLRASGISEELLREVLAPLLPEGATLKIEAQEEVQLHWNDGSYRREASDWLDALTGDVSVALAGVELQNEALALGLTDVTLTAELGGSDLDLALRAGVAPGAVGDLIGERLQADVRLAGPGVQGAGAMTIELESPGLNGTFAGRFEGGALRIEERDAVQLEWRLNEDGLQRIFGPSLGPGQSIAPTQAAQATTRTAGLVSIRDLRLPLAGGGAGQAEESPSPSLADLLAVVDVATPALTVRGGTGTNGELPALHGTLEVRPRTPPTLVLNAPKSGDAAPLEVSLTALTPLDDSGELPAMAVEVRGEALPTPLIDALTRAEGLVVDVFGPTVDVRASSPSWSASEGSFEARLNSPRATTTVQGSLQDGVLRTTEGAGLDATLGLSPLFSERIVGPLLPLVVDVTKPDGAGPCSFRVHDVAFPLDGDLSKLDAVVELELGEVIYSLLPGFDDSFLDDVRKARQRNVRPVRVRIQDGVAHYDGLPIEIDGHDLGFRGSFGLVDRRLAFDADVPLAVLGDDVGEKARKYVGPDVGVPVRITGTTARPSFNVSLEGLLQSAAGGLLNRWLGGR